MDSPSRIFRRLHHICIVVRDLEESVAYFKSIGVGPWKDYPPLDGYLHDLQVQDPDAFLKNCFAFVELDNVQLQLCQPAAGDTPHRRFLERHGEGVFQLGFGVPDCDEAEAEGRSMGMDVMMRARRADGSGFTFFDTAQQAGVTLQIRYAPLR